MGTIEKKKNNTKKSNKNIEKDKKSSLKLEIWGIFIICISILLIISVYFKSGGFLGNMLNIFLKGVFGVGAYILPIMLIAFCISIFLSNERKLNVYKFILSIILFILTISIFHIFSKKNIELNTGYMSYLLSKYKSGGAINGGLLGAIIGDIFLKLIGKMTSIIFIVIISTALIFLLMGKSFFKSIYIGFIYIKDKLFYDKLIEEDEHNTQDEEDEESYNVRKHRKKTIFSKIRDKINEKINNNYEYDEYEDDEYIQKPYQRPKYEYKVTKEAKFFDIEPSKKNNIKKISLATDEINAPYTNNIYNPIQNNEKQQENVQGDINITYESNLYDDTYNEYIEQENTQNKNTQNTNETHTQKNNDDENTFKIQSKEDFINNVYKKRKIDTKIPTGIIKNVDVDLAQNDTNIDEMFDIPPEQYLSEYTSEEELKKIDEFYNFTEYYKDYETEDEKEKENNIEETEEEIEEIETENKTETENNTEDNIKIENKAKQQENINNNTRPSLAPINTQNNEKIEKGYTPIKNQNDSVYTKPPKSTENDKDAENTENPTIIKVQKEKMLSKGENEKEEQKEYIFPKLKFLNRNTYVQSEESDKELIKNSNLLTKTLKSFNVAANVINISKGPSVTRYELSIEDGIKVSKILGLSDNLALSLAAQSIRIEAPIPGKSAVGIEIPNSEVRSVFLSEVLCSRTFQEAKSRLSFGLGKDITGNVIVTDIAKMPHMLIAGATGSGKSVCINTLISSILYKASPNDVKLMMIDPKVVELSIYNGIPHLLTPVVTDPEKASGVLNWAVSEMMERYELFSKTSTRNLVGYNEICEKNGCKRLPQIVIIIDELADLMMVAAKEVEASICRLAQLARAAGIHLIIATQRPSVDVITGLIKANIPSRIAFAVSSGTDSRTVLDTVGAEKLLGKGDMLFKSVNMNKPLRIQGAFISDKEVETIVSFIKENGEANYDDNIINKIEKDTTQKGEGADTHSDELLDDVIGFLVKKKKASTSLVQRQFRIGYNRAARIIEELEDRGIISEERGSKQRDVLMDKYEYEEYLNRYDNY